MSCEWELSKENVEPLKSGRSIQTLKNALTSKACHLNAREMKRKEFESELRTYSGSDLLSVYYDYIQWIEQNYPLGGNEANLKTLLEKCIEQFYALDEYRNDPRLLNVFLKFIKRVDSPLDVFQFFHENLFAQQLSDFYINWSFHLENSKNCRKAADVLRLGLSLDAQPIGALKAALDHLETRVAKAIANKQSDDLNENYTENDQKRQALNKLKTKTIKKGCVDAPVSRVGNAVKASGGGLKTVTTGGAHNSSSKVPMIYCDENDPTIEDRLSATKTTVNYTTQVSSVGSIGQENEIKADKWTEHQVKQKPIVKSEPTFTIYADEDESDDCSDDEPTPKPSQSNVLKMRAKCEDIEPMARFEKPDPKMKFHVNLNKLYAGGEEYSFEEIRGRQWILSNKPSQNPLTSKSCDSC